MEGLITAAPCAAAESVSAHFSLSFWERVGVRVSGVVAILMELKTCPSCHSRVYFSASGECPACRTTLGAAQVGNSQPSPAKALGRQLSPAAPGSRNPYASPQAPLAAPAVEDARHELRRIPYPIALRFWALNIDVLAAIILCLIVGKQLDENGFSTTIQVVAIIATYFLYYIPTEAILAATPGKLLLGIKVVRRDGGGCTFGQILIRNLLRPFETNLIGYAVALLTKHKQRIGDLLAGTVVVRR